MIQPLEDIRSMCREIDHKEAEDCLYLRWVLCEHVLTSLSPWLKKKPKRLNFSEFKKSIEQPARTSQKPDRAAFYAAYGPKIKKPEGG